MVTKCPQGLDCSLTSVITGKLEDQIVILYSAVGTVGIILLVWAGVILMWSDEGKGKAKNMFVLGVVLCASSFSGFIFTLYTYFFK